MDLLTVLCGEIVHLRTGLVILCTVLNKIMEEFWKRCGKSEKR